MVQGGWCTAGLSELNFLLAFNKQLASGDGDRADGIKHCRVDANAFWLCRYEPQLSHYTSFGAFKQHTAFLSPHIKSHQRHLYQTFILIYTETQSFFWELSNEPVSTEGDKAKSASRAHLLCNPRRCECIALLNCLGIHLHRSITEARFKYVIH